MKIRSSNEVGRLFFVVTFLVFLGSCIYVYGHNEGNKFLSGNGGTKWITANEANMEYLSMEKSLGLPTVNKPKNVRPHYAFGYMPGFYESESSRWWTHTKGSIEASYPAVLITDELLTSWRNNLHQAGWETSLSPEAFDTKIQEQVRSREKLIQQTQRDALQEYCINSPSCQERYEKSLLKLNDEPIKISFNLTRGEGVFYAYITLQNDLVKKTASVDLRMEYSCTTAKC